MSRCGRIEQPWASRKLRCCAGGERKSTDEREESNSRWGTQDTTSECEWMLANATRVSVGVSRVITVRRRNKAAEWRIGHCAEGRPGSPQFLQLSRLRPCRQP